MPYSTETEIIECAKRAVEDDFGNLPFKIIYINCHFDTSDAFWKILLDTDREILPTSIMMNIDDVTHQITFIHGL